MPDGASLYLSNSVKVWLKTALLFSRLENQFNWHRRSSSGSWRVASPRQALWQCCTSWPQGVCQTIDSRFITDRFFVGYRDCIHIKPQADYRSGLSAPDQTSDAGTGYAVFDFCAAFLQNPTYDARCPDFFETRLRMGMDAAPDNQ